MIAVLGIAHEIEQRIRAFRERNTQDFLALLGNGRNRSVIVREFPRQLGGISGR